jgi:hypothetical protein
MGKAAALAEFSLPLGLRTQSSAQQHGDSHTSAFFLLQVSDCTCAVRLQAIATKQPPRSSVEAAVQPLLQRYIARQVTFTLLCARPLIGHYQKDHAAAAGEARIVA